MNLYYYLKHKDQTAANLVIDSESHTLLDYCLTNKEAAPFLGNLTRKNMVLWLQNRMIPANRDGLRQLLQEAGCSTREDYLFKNLGLSITDSYWLCPADATLHWIDVNLFDHLLSSKLPVRHENSYSPDATLSGQMSKYVDYSGPFPELVKTSAVNYGLQCLNEQLASDIHGRLRAAPYTSYIAQYDSGNDRMICRCPLFTSYELEFVSAYEVIQSGKKPGDMSDYEFFIELCERNGIPDARHFMDYMTLTDFVITNTDRHLNNFGVLRDPETMQFVSMAPIFDSGNSMFYDRMNRRGLTRAEILALPVISFHRSEEKMLKHISDRDLIDPELLPGPDEIIQFYTSFLVPENVASVIAQNYQTKREMLSDFRRGETISLYIEKTSGTRGRVPCPTNR